MARPSPPRRPRFPPCPPPRQSEGFYARERVLSNGRPSTSASDGGAGAYLTPAPIPLPTKEEVAADGAGFVSTIRRLTSPVYYSTLPDGRVVQGFEGIPRRPPGGGGRPLLFIGNHGFFAADMYMMVGRAPGAWRCAMLPCIALHRIALLCTPYLTPRGLCLEAPPRPTPPRPAPPRPAAPHPPDPRHA
jgi:hypothetical protein